MNKSDVFVGKGLNHCPSIEVVSIDVCDIAAFYLGVVAFYTHLFVICLGISFGPYECQPSPF